MSVVAIMPARTALAAFATGVVEKNRECDVSHGAWINARLDARATQENDQSPREIDLRYSPSAMSEVIVVPFERLTFHYREIGVHRGRRWGFRAVFDFDTLSDLPFCHLASKVKQAYENKDVPAHEGWPAQREALKWLVDKGHDGIYELDQKGIKIRHTPFRSYYIVDGHHRALALYVLGASQIRARIKN